MAGRFRVLLDANVYGNLLEDQVPDLLVKVRGTDKIVVYGFEVIRKELRAISKKLKHGKRSYRALTLSVYDELVGRHNYDLTTIIELLAREYARAYRGGISKKAMGNDFLIVACATLHDLDIVVSEDRHSMLSGPALRAYEAVNKANDLNTPAFYSLKKFAKLL